MQRIRICVAPTLVLMLLAGCAAKSGDDARPPVAGTGNAGQPQSVDIHSIVEAATRDLSSRLNIDPATVAVVRTERVTWSDGSVGCPVAGMQYTEALVPGYQVVLRAGGQTFDYHAAANGHFVLCPPERAIEPVPGDPI